MIASKASAEAENVFWLYNPYALRISMSVCEKLATGTAVFLAGLAASAVCEMLRVTKTTRAIDKRILYPHFIQSFLYVPAMLWILCTQQMCGVAAHII